jgi:hypothetical protein
MSLLDAPIIIPITSCYIYISLNTCTLVINSFRFTRRRLQLGSRKLVLNKTLVREHLFLIMLIFYLITVHFNTKSLWRVYTKLETLKPLDIVCSCRVCTINSCRIILSSMTFYHARAVMFLYRTL